MLAGTNINLNLGRKALVICKECKEEKPQHELLKEFCSIDCVRDFIGNKYSEYDPKEIQYLMCQDLEKHEGYHVFHLISVMIMLLETLSGDAAKPILQKVKDPKLKMLVNIIHQILCEGLTPMLPYIVMMHKETNEEDSKIGNTLKHICLWHIKEKEVPELSIGKPNLKIEACPCIKLKE